MNKDCSHKFVGPNACAHCGATMEQVKAAGYDEALKLLHEQSAEVARLREERHEWATKCEDERAARQAAEARVTELERERDAEKAARGQDIRSMSRTIEQLNMDLERNKRLKLDAATDRDQAQQRVAELEAIKPLLDAEALSSARGLLGQCAWITPAKTDLARRIRAWLRAHPATDNPARSCPRCGGIITQQTHVCPATPALKPLALVEDRTPEQDAVEQIRRMTG